MNRLNIILKNKISNLRCIDHNSVPIVRINEGKLNFDCCCDSFKEKAKDVIAKAAKDFIESELRSVLKGR